MRFHCYMSDKSNVMRGNITLVQTTDAPLKCRNAASAVATESAADALFTPLSLPIAG
jgi:hypothetical protein